MGKYEMVATASLLLNFSSFSSLLYNVMTTHNTSTLPYFWFYTNILAQILMLIYAYSNGAYGIYIPTVFLLIGIVYMLTIKLYYENDTDNNNNNNNNNNNKNKNNNFN